MFKYTNKVLESQVDEKLKDFKTELATKEHVTAELTKTKVELIKWMVGLIFGLFIALLGSMAALIRLMMHCLFLLFSFSFFFCL